MESLLHYGRRSQLNLHIADEALVADCPGPRGRAIDNPSLAVELALEAPLDFPPLEQAVTPGDHVTLALGDGVPRVADVVRPVIEALLRRGVQAESITVLRSQRQADEGQHPLAALDPSLAASIALATHHPADRSQLSYLAATAEGRPIYLHRTLCDADLVLPIACIQQGPASGDFAAGIYPTFSDVATQERYRNPRLADGDGEIADRARHEANEVAWLLGVLFAVQTVPGQAGELLSVVAGHYESVTKHARNLHQQAWVYHVPQRASLVVASVEGEQQTWDNLGRAAAAAANAVAEDGTIAILCDLHADPGPGIRRIADFESPQQAVRRLRKERPRDVFAAVQLARALSRSRVYLLSQLEEAVTEGLGMTPVEQAEDIGRLARRHPSCIVLGNAQYATVRTDVP